MGHEVLLMVTGEPVQGQTETRPVVRSPSVLAVHATGDRCLLRQPLLRVSGGQLVVVPALHPGQAGVGAGWALCT